jgi:hemoglobin-like flavoprotein
MTATGETRAAATATAPPSPLDVDALDVDALERSFDLVAPHGTQLVEHFYDLLFERAPDLRAMFPDLERQRTSLLATLVVLRRSLRDLPALAPTLRKLGARHVSYGARPEHYPIVAELLIRAMHETAGPRWSALDTAQWEKALQLVAVEMLAGAASTAQPAGAGSAAGATRLSASVRP